MNPEIIIPEPNYDNLSIIGVSRQGIGATTDTGSNLLIDVKVGASKTTVGIGSTTFEISEFQIARPGHSFKVGDKFKPVGLVTAAHLSAPLQEFELEVVQTFSDKFSSWQFGELDFIDSIGNLQDGARKRFPLFFNGQLLSFEKDLTNSRSQLIDLNAILLIFVNGVLQKPSEAYQFEGGTTFEFIEAPKPDAKVDIFFYKGQDGVDVDTADIQQTVKIGDEVRLFKHPVGLTTSQEAERTLNALLGAKLVETDIYTGAGIDENNSKPFRWTKQKVDIVLNGKKIDKSREILEPQVYPTAKIIGDLSSTSGEGNTNGIFVDDAEVFFYEKGDHLSGSNPDESDGDYNLAFSTVDALITSGEISVGAAATALVSAAGTISSLDITNGGSGYSGSATIKISSPPTIGVGVGTTAVATATITNGVITGTTITNPGLGYSAYTPPQVLVELPTFQTEKLTAISNVEGFTGIITGISTTTGTGSHPLALKFFFRADKAANGLLENYPVFITDTTVGNGVTSVNDQDSSVVGIGTTFVDNIYIVNDVDTLGEAGEITCNIHTNSTSSVLGIAVTGNFNNSNPGIATHLGRITWGRLYNASRNTSPISIGVTGLTINSGLTTFPTIQRKNYTVGSLRGLRSSGAIRVAGI